ncbi:MAG: hypothetical protein GX201_01140 [Clostridiales bacterium]|nr:hypothetical protein [Clostridiales bacterium]
MKYKRKISYIIIFMLTIMLLASCVQEIDKPETEEQTEEPEQQEQQENKVDIGTYYPLAVGNQWEYEGVGNEFAEYTQKVIYSKDNKYQVMIDNGGTITANIYVLRDESLVRTYSEAEVYDEKNVLDEESNMEDIIIKLPLKVGTKWESQGNQCEITDIDATVTVPAGTFDNCIVIKVTYKESGAFSNLYYCKEVGLVKSEYIDNDNDFEVLSLLRSYNLSDK